MVSDRFGLRFGLRVAPWTRLAGIYDPGPPRTDQRQGEWRTEEDERMSKPGCLRSRGGVSRVWTASGANRGRFDCSHLNSDPFIDSLLRAGVPRDPTRLGSAVLVTLGDDSGGYLNFFLQLGNVSRQPGWTETPDEDPERFILNQRTGMFLISYSQGIMEEY